MTVSGLRPVATLVLRWLDTAGGPCDQAGAGSGPRRFGRRLEQGGVPIPVRHRRPAAAAHSPGRRLGWPELFESLAGAAVTHSKPCASQTPVWSERSASEQGATSHNFTAPDANNTLYWRRTDSQSADSRLLTESGSAQRAQSLAAERRPVRLLTEAGSAQRAQSPAAERRPVRPAEQRWPTVGRLGRLLAWLGRRRHYMAETERRGQRLVVTSKHMSRARQMRPSAVLPGAGVGHPPHGMVSRHRVMPATFERRAPSGQRQRLAGPVFRRPEAAMARGARSSASAARRRLRPLRSRPVPSRRRPRTQAAHSGAAAGHTPSDRTAAPTHTQPAAYNNTAASASTAYGIPANGARTKGESRGQRKPKQKPGLNINLNFSLDNLRAKLKSSIKTKKKSKGSKKPQTKPKYPKSHGNHIMCDCKSNLGDLLGFLPLALLVGYSTSVSTAAAAAASGASTGGVTVTINDADTTTIANTNSPTLTNTDNDVITTAANANPVNTNTNTLTNNDNDVITNTNTATNNGRSATTTYITGLSRDGTGRGGGLESLVCPGTGRDGVAAWKAFYTCVDSYHQCQARYVT